MSLVRSIPLVSRFCRSMVAHGRNDMRTCATQIVSAFLLPFLRNLEISFASVNHFMKEKVEWFHKRERKIMRGAIYIYIYIIIYIYICCLTMSHHSLLSVQKNNTITIIKLL